MEWGRGTIFFSGGDNHSLSTITFLDKRQPNHANNLLIKLVLFKITICVRPLLDWLGAWPKLESKLHIVLWRNATILVLW
jgi:hypothetical protein